MTKRTLISVLVPLGAGLAGTAVGYALRAPGRNSTWSDIRAWATFIVVVAGFSVAAYELNLQRRQFAAEALRNADRDDLLDRQRRELGRAEASHQREQADAVDLQLCDPSSVLISHIPLDEQPGTIVVVKNDRP